ncbi:hypothetical protein LJC47_03245 [Desulfosarcina sp. OttesenSCG-928-B08]|nr:hypothetical protein [Desulfosarcina sp. OttesenSCG-928-B08]
MIKAALLGLMRVTALTGTATAAEPGIKVKITVGKETLTATFLDNATTRSLISRFPLTVPMIKMKKLLDRRLNFLWY